GVGIRPRGERMNADGGVAGRRLELVSVVDDGGDVAVALDAARQFVEQDDVFAVVLASAAPEPELTDYLAGQFVPFFGWGFAPGFCDPNQWGFGFNGCLLGVPGADPDVSTRELTTDFFDRPATVVLITTADAAGNAVAAQAGDVWGENLLEVIQLEATSGGDFTAVRDILAANAPDIALLAVGLDLTIALKADLIGRFEGMVLDDVSYLPGLLGDFVTSDKLQGGYSVTQFPPQEEYREVTAIVATDLERVGGDLVYSRAVSIGYWSTDLLGAILAAVGPDLDTASFYEAANVDGVDYNPGFVGAPCPMNTLDIHGSPAGGAALVRVDGGVYRPVVAFGCY
ncbi:MAG: ABC transporter substrate-binding protein, partial [Acidimicrobiales bacterium]